MKDVTVEKSKVKLLPMEPKAPAPWRYDNAKTSKKALKGKKQTIEEVEEIFMLAKALHRPLRLILPISAMVKRRVTASTAAIPVRLFITIVIKKAII